MQSLNLSEDTHTTLDDSNTDNPTSLSSNRDKNLKPEESGERAKSRKKTVSFLHDLQLAKMYLLVVFNSFFLNLPNAVGLALFHHRLKYIGVVAHFKLWTITLVAMNSTVNCLIFFWANRNLRQEGWRVCKRMFKR